jgi:hypothetical protein
MTKTFAVKYLSVCYYLHYIGVLPRTKTSSFTNFLTYVPTKTTPVTLTLWNFRLMTRSTSFRLAPSANALVAGIVIIRHPSLLLPLWSIGHPWNALFHFSFLILYTVGRTPWTGVQLVARPLPKQTQNKSRKPCMSGIRTHDPSVRAATLIGTVIHSRQSDN